MKIEKVLKKKWKKAPSLVPTSFKKGLKKRMKVRLGG